MFTFICVYWLSYTVPLVGVMSGPYTFTFLVTLRWYIGGPTDFRFSVYFVQSFLHLIDPKSIQLHITPSIYNLIFYQVGETFYQTVTEYVSCLNVKLNL